jgi:hypothetical protein
LGRSGPPGRRIDHAPGHRGLEGRRDQFCRNLRHASHAAFTAHLRDFSIADVMSATAKAGGDDRR